MFDFTEWAYASPAIYIHTAVAVLGFVIGAMVLVIRKGTARHKLLGRIFGVAALATALSSFFIHEINLWGQWSHIHLISIYVIFSVITSIAAIRKGNVVAHQNGMLALYVSGFIIAGGFTFMPDRLLYHTVISPTLSRFFDDAALLRDVMGWAVPAIACCAALIVWLRFKADTKKAPAAMSRGHS